MVIREIKTASGATVRIHDDYIAPRGSEEEKRRIDAQRMIASEILRRAKESRPVG